MRRDLTSVQAEQYRKLLFRDASVQASRELVPFLRGSRRGMGGVKQAAVKYAERLNEDTAERIKANRYLIDFLRRAR